MRREYRIPVRAVLNGTAPAALKVVIKPAEETANARAANYSFGVPGLTQPGGLGYYNFLRKPASDFGWDWGPAFAPAGIYGTVELQAYSGAFLTGGGTSVAPVLCCRLVVPCTPLPGQAYACDLMLRLPTLNYPRQGQGDEKLWSRSYSQVSAKFNLTHLQRPPRARRTRATAACC